MTNNTSIGRNAILNSFTLIVSLAVAFFLSPFLVHRLGSVGYGTWTLVTSMISYMALLDLGLGRVEVARPVLEGLDDLTGQLHPPVGLAHVELEVGRHHLSGLPDAEALFRICLPLSAPAVT